MCFKFLTLVSLSVLSVISAEATTGDCDRRCDIHDEFTVVCKGLGNQVPQCLPSSTEVLRIHDSPSYTNFNKSDFAIYRSLRVLSIKNTSLTNYFGLANQDTLQTIEIVSAFYLANLSIYLFEGWRNLKTIRIQNCPLLEEVQDIAFAFLDKLETLDLRDNEIKEIGADILYQSKNVSYIDLSNNKDLKYLPRYVFADLDKLINLNIENCGFEVIYSDIVSTPYESGSLQIFDALFNPWNCLKMCEFITWLEGTDSFFSLDTMGLCSKPEYLAYKPVVTLQPDDVCYHTDPVVVIVFGLLFMSVLALACCFLLAVRHCLVGMCCRNSSPRVPEDATATSNRRHVHSNHSYVDTEAVPTETILQSNCNVGDWNIYSVEPPSYADVTCKQVNENNNNDPWATSDTDSDCPDIEPPPYEEDRNL